MLLHSLCPCGSEKLYTDCCEPYLTGKTMAPTAEVLMRSRYTAYSKGNVDYLIATHQAKNQQPGDRATLLQTIQTTRWVGLTILKTQKGQAKDKRGIVEFVALYQILQNQTLKNQTLPNQATQNLMIQTTNLQSTNLPSTNLQNENCVHQLHERSRFIKEAGRWLYVDGDILPPIQLRSSIKLDIKSDGMPNRMQ